MDWKRATSSAVSGLWVVERIIGLAGLPSDVGWWRNLMYHIPDEIGLFALGVFVTLILQSHGPLAIAWAKGLWRAEKAPDELHGKFAAWLKKEAREMVDFLVFMLIRLPIMMGTLLLVGYLILQLLTWIGRLTGILQ